MSKSDSLLNNNSNRASFDLKRPKDRDQSPSTSFRLFPLPFSSTTSNNANNNGNNNINDNHNDNSNNNNEGKRRTTSHQKTLAPSNLNSSDRHSSPMLPLSKSDSTVSPSLHQKARPGGSLVLSTSAISPYSRPQSSLSSSLATTSPLNSSPSSLKSISVHIQIYQELKLKALENPSTVHSIEDHRLRIFIAAEVGIENVLQEALLKCQIDINARNEEGETLLHIACARGYYNLLHLFLEQSNLNKAILNSSNESPLDIAASNGHVNIVEKLLEAGYEAKEETIRKAQTNGRKTIFLLLTKAMLQNKRKDLSDLNNQTPKEWF